MTRTIFITGATAGIGRHLALHLAARGHHVIASGRKPELLASLRREVRGRLDTVELDVTDGASIERAAAEATRLTGGRGVDALVNNAGYGQPGPLEELADGELRRQFETNVFGLMAVTRAFLPQLKAARGRLVNLSSIGGRVTFPLFGAYHASKYAVEALSDALRNELAPFGVRVALIEPGPIRTEFGDRAISAIDAVARPGSAYGAIYARADEIAALARKQEVGPEVVSRAIEHAIVARRPRARYVVPFTSRLLIAVMRALPQSWADALVRRIAGLTPDRLGVRRELGPATAR
jgi:NAD(P)-dependent dehydrogenase (short-subunit alcohol dehydrogenase family)